MSPSQVPASHLLSRRMIIASVMLGSTLQSIDTTIANVALPHIQGSLSASQDQMAWVLTSYIIASAIMTPLSGWLAGRFGRRWVLLFSLGGFTIASALCGLAQDLPQIVLFRVLQGLSGAALMPMSQAVMLDMVPRSEQTKMMATWGVATIVGPMLGPILGGWLTDHYNWRWVFYINVPLGVLAFLGILNFMPRVQRQWSKVDFTGFSLLAVAIGAFQLMIDRGPTKDWFGSNEIWIEFGTAVLCLYLFIVHSVTFRTPFIRLALFKDRNFVTGLLFMSISSMVMYANLTLLPPMMETLLGYPTLDAGMTLAPRSLGTVTGMYIIARLAGKMDERILVGIGYSLVAHSVWQMTHFNFDVPQWMLMWTGFEQGIGTGLAIVSLTTLAFASLPTSLRNEASAMYALIRNLAGSISLSFLQAELVDNTQVMHARLTESISPFSMLARSPRMAEQLDTIPGMVGLNATISAQAQMVAYLNDFKLVMVLTFLTLPMVLFVRPARSAVAAANAADLHNDIHIE